MKSWLVKARHANAVILNQPCHPDEGWFFVVEVPLSEIPAKDFIVKKPKQPMGSPCPKCDAPMWGTTGAAVFCGCFYCGYEVEWVYAKYRFVWKD